MSSTSTPAAVVTPIPGTPGQTTMPLTWEPPATGPAPTAYEVDYSPTGQNQWTTSAAGLTATSDTVNNLLPGTTYDFRITPSNASGAGQPSIITATTAAVPATTPLVDTGYYGTSIQEGLHRGAFIVREANGFRSRERATITNNGASALLYPAGLVVALTGAPGAYTVAPFTSAGTAATTAAIVFDNKMVQPGQTVPVAIVARDAEVNFLELQLDGSITTPALTSIVQQALAASHIICR